jgi:DNA-binding IclR family transcriptional regulator
MTKTQTTSPGSAGRAKAKATRAADKPAQEAAVKHSAAKRSAPGKQSGKDEGSAVGRRSGVQSFDVGATLLEVLARHLGPMHLRDIAAEAGMSSSKAHRYLISLQRAGLAEQDPATGRYDLGAASLRIGLAALNRLKVVQYATQALVEFNQEEDLTVALSIWGDNGPTIVSWYDSTQIVICNLHVGSVLPLLRSAAGQLFLAYLPRETTRSMVERELGVIVTYLPNTPIRTRTQVDALVKRIRQERTGRTQEDLVPRLSAYAAPVFDHLGRIVATVSLIAPTGIVHSSSAERISSKLLALADRVSVKLGRDPAVLHTSYVEMVERGDYQAAASALQAQAAEPATNEISPSRARKRGLAKQPE